MKNSLFKKIIREEITRLFEADPEQPDPTKPPAEDGSDAAKQAHQLGLTHTGYGYWDDKSGNTVARTVKGHLVKLTDKDKPSSAHGSASDVPTKVISKNTGPSFKPKLDVMGPDDYTATTPPPLRPQQTQKIKAGDIDPSYEKKIPGSITPPKNKDGNPWEVVDAQGKPGLIDFIDNKGNQAHVTYDDGSFGMVRLDQLKPRTGPNKPYQVPGPDKKPLFPGDQGESDYPWRKT